MIFLSFRDYKDQFIRHRQAIKPGGKMMKKMLMVLCMVLTTVVTIKLSVASPDAQANGYKTALNFVVAFFVEKNVEKTLHFVSSLASWSTQESGSAIQELKKVTGQDLRIRELVFFEKDSFAATMIKLSERYHITKQKWTNGYPPYINKFLSKSSVGCLAVIDIGAKENQRPIILSLVFDKENGQYKMIHFSDPI